MSDTQPPTESDESLERTSIPLELVPTNELAISELGLTEAGDARIYSIRQTFLSRPSDWTYILAHIEEIPMEELIFRQFRYRCLSSEEAVINARIYPNDSITMKGIIENTTFTPDYDTLEAVTTGGGIDPGVNLSLAYSLVTKALNQGDLVEKPVKTSFAEFEDAVERVGGSFLFNNLRNNTLRLIDKDIIAYLLSTGMLNDQRLSGYFSCVSQLQLELVFKAMKDKKISYVPPHPYSILLRTDTSKNSQDALVPDLRYLPYVFKTHKEYLEELLTGAGELVVIEPSKVKTGVEALYEFAGRTIGFYPRPLEEDDQRTINKVEELATTMSSEFSRLVRQFNGRFKRQAPKVVPDPVTESAPPEYHGPSRFKEHLRNYGASAANNVRKKPGLGLKEKISHDE